MFPITYFKTLIILSLILYYFWSVNTILRKADTVEWIIQIGNHKYETFWRKKRKNVNECILTRKKNQTFFFCTFHFWLIVICNVVRIADDFHVSFTNPSVHVCIFGCRCRPIQDGRVPRSAFFWTFNSRLFWKVP